MSNLELRIAAQRDAVRDYCERVYERRNFPPSCRDVAAALALPFKTASRRMREINDAGDCSFDLLTNKAGRPRDGVRTVDDAMRANARAFAAGRSMRYL